MLPSADTLRFLARIERLNLVLGAIAVIIAIAALGWTEMSAGVLTGVLIAAANFRAIVWLAGKIVSGPKRSQRTYAVLAGCKFALLLGVVWAVLALLPVSPFGFVIGVSTLLPAIFGGSLFTQSPLAGSEG